MKPITNQQQRVLKLLIMEEKMQSSQIHEALLKQNEKCSLITVKRMLSALVKNGLIESTGAGRSTAYRLTTLGRLKLPIEATDYCKTEPDKRFGQTNYNFELLKELPTELFDKEELNRLAEATRVFQNRKKNVSPVIAKKELERLVIELSWKSSKIEGNTYTLLDTEKLIMEHSEAPGHDHAEAQMILNHKDTFTFIHQHADQFKKISRANIEHVHSLLTHDLDVGKGLRSSPVGVVGSRYRPLDNKHQITDAVQSLISSVNGMKSSYAKSLMALLGISYIQPFEDGNKRTSRIMANAILIAHDCAPLSYRSVDENAYREAMFIFYELNSLVPFKNIYMEQYLFAAENYAIA